MNNNLNPEKERLTKSESDYEKALRPSAFDGFAGQEQIKENLKIFQVFNLQIKSLLLQLIIKHI